MMCDVRGTRVCVEIFCFLGTTTTNGTAAATPWVSHVCRRPVRVSRVYRGSSFLSSSARDDTTAAAAGRKSHLGSLIGGHTHWRGARTAGFPELSILDFSSELNLT